MMASIRTAFRVIWEVRGPTYARGKLRDLLLVALAGGLILVAFAASLIAQVIAEAGKGLSDALGLEGAAAAAGTVVEVAGRLLVGFLALAILYSVVPPIKVQLGAVWPSAALAALAIEVLSRGFAIYTAKTGLNHIYGPFGVVFTFLLLIYLLATILLLGAELTAIRGHAAQERPQHEERDRAASA